MPTRRARELADRAPARPGDAEPASPPEIAGGELLSGAYVTDGRSLFRVEHTHSDQRTGEMFLELENCTSLELSVWPADHLLSRPLRCVTPVGTPEPDSAALA